VYNHELKLDRALYHLQSLESEITTWLKSKPHQLIHDFDIKSGEKLLVAELLEPVPPKFRLIIGDCLHNMRSALDNLVYDLATAYIGIDPLPKHRARVLEFPIFTDRTMRPDECRNKIGCIHPDAQAIIKELQPYERGEEARLYTLSVLHVLSAKDKHRFPNVVSFSPKTISLYIPGHGGIFNAKPTWGVIEGRAEIMRYFSPTGVYAEVDMQKPPTFFVAFGKGAPDVIYGAPVEGVLSELYKWIIRKVVPPLAPYLG
jgi:hypothetical protein